MSSSKKISSALISVYHKENLEPIVRLLERLNIKIYSTGGTQKFIEAMDVAVTPVEEVTDYPSILGGRVKTLHPKIFGGVLSRRELESDQKAVADYEIPAIDLVIVDLYPFEETVKTTSDEAAIIEKIDIGGISLIRAGAKNFKDVVIVSSREQYPQLELLLKEKEGHTDIEDRKLFAAQAFDISSHYDTAIFNYFNQDNSLKRFKKSEREHQILRYGENPHQEGVFYGRLEDMFLQLNGKALSYNNLVDVDAAVALIEEFPEELAFGILKHTNACGIAIGESVKEAYLKALQADPVSAFGGVLITNRKVTAAAAEEMHKLFFEILIAPEYEDEAVDILKGKKNRILLVQKMPLRQKKQFKNLLNGVIEQDRDLKTDTREDFKEVTERKATEEEKNALLFASKVAKHTKSNTIVLAKEGQLLASGVGQTSRVDALKQAIEKATAFGFDLNGTVMASDAFFPFPDCVEIGHKAGVVAVIQPGGSIRDKDSIDYCNKNNIAMILTGFRHFKH